MFPLLLSFAEGGWTPKSNFCSKVIVPYTRQGVMKICYLHHETLGISGKISNRPKNGLREPRKKTGSGSFMVVRGQGQGKYSRTGIRSLPNLNLPSAPISRKYPGFLISLPRCGAEGEEKGMRLKSCQQSNTSIDGVKLWLIFLKIFLLQCVQSEHYKSIDPVYTACRLVAMPCLTLCNLMDCSMPGSSVLTIHVDVCSHNPEERQDVLSMQMDSLYSFPVIPFFQEIISILTSFIKYQLFPVLSFLYMES